MTKEIEAVAKTSRKKQKGGKKNKTKPEL